LTCALLQPGGSDSARRARCVGSGCYPTLSGHGERGRAEGGGEGGDRIRRSRVRRCFRPRVVWAGSVRLGNGVCVINGARCGAGGRALPPRICISPSSQGSRVDRSSPTPTVTRPARSAGSRRDIDSSRSNGREQDGRATETGSALERGWVSRAMRITLGERVKPYDSSQILDFRALVHAPTPHPSTAAGQT